MGRREVTYRLADVRDVFVGGSVGLLALEDYSEFGLHDFDAVKLEIVPGMPDEGFGLLALGAGCFLNDGIGQHS